MTTKFFDRLSNDLTRLLENPTDYNVAIEIGEAPNNQIFKVHSYILQSRSPYFEKKFNETPFNDDHIKVLTMPNPNISIKIFNVIIKYIYGGIISLEKLENSTIFDLVIASNELELDELVKHLQTYLVNNGAPWLRLKFAQIYRTSYQVKNLEIIRDFYNDIIAKHPNTIFESENFLSLPEGALISILKQDDLQLEEGKIWEYVIKWGKAKNSTLPTNFDKWTSDNFLTLKETLKGCLPHIRYFSLSNEDVIERIFPYQQILEPKLFLDINSKIMTPNKQISSIILPPRNILNIQLPIRNTPIPLPSNIITNEHALEISSWIDKKETLYVENNPYEFELLVRGSRDGFDDDLQLEEGKIWEYVIKWGKAKNSTLPTNFDKWTSDNFLTLKETLKGCLPHIRYFSLSNEDVIERIFPYQQILEPKLFLDINSKIMTPNKQISSIILPPRNILNIQLPIRNTPIPLPSNIITNEHALEISSWIDKKETLYVENNPYEFELLVRGSRDGFDVKTIYNICDKIANTVIILKVKGTGEILGGYNPLEWDNNNDQLKYTQDSFIFSLKTTNLKNSILSRAKNLGYAIYNYPKNSDFSFNVALCLIGNLKTEKRCYCMVTSEYSKPIRSGKFISPEVYLSNISHKFLFSVEECEVFKILPRNDLK
ncbi:hypothetical protein Glove_350g177 [Diversispora epigaea]|uniref:BTB domain-containing protein n=1 Tax=Diversispora epigaea TaxID=1348612 RepID=A0A397HK96_9GLOM|nr:hypothetical protein Glove_350g177 [Diversispora epigaea]